MASHPDLKHGRWDLEQFWRLGEDEITRVMSTAATLGYPAGNDTALDFGCGVGRLTRAMACHFSHSTGVDVAETMIEQATRLDDGAACTFVVNQTNDLARFGDSTFDFVYSALVLQHLPTVEVIRGFIAEFLRVLNPTACLLSSSRPGYRHQPAQQTAPPRSGRAGGPTRAVRGR